MTLDELVDEMSTWLVDENTDDFLEVSNLGSLDDRLLRSTTGTEVDGLCEAVDLKELEDVRSCLVGFDSVVLIEGLDVLDDFDSDVV